MTDGDKAMENAVKTDDTAFWTRKAAPNRTMEQRKMTTNDLEEFLQREPPKGKKSRLDPHADEIFALHDQRYSLDQIRRYLAERKSVTISRQNLHLWIKRHENDRPAPATAAGKKVQPAPVQSSPALEISTPVPVVATANAKPRPAPVIEIPPTQPASPEAFNEQLQRIEEQQEKVVEENSLAERQKRFAGNSGSQ